MTLQIECTNALHNIVNRDSQTDWIREWKKALCLHEEKVEQHKNVWIIFVYVWSRRKGLVNFADTLKIFFYLSSPFMFACMYMKMKKNSCFRDKNKEKRGRKKEKTPNLFCIHFILSHIWDNLYGVACKAQTICIVRKYKCV